MRRRAGDANQGQRVGSASVQCCGEPVKKEGDFPRLEALVGGDGLHPLDMYPAMERCQDGEVTLIH